MNPPTNINTYRIQKAQETSSREDDDSAELINWRKVIATGSAFLALGGAALGLAKTSEQHARQGSTVPVEFVHNENGTFLQHRVAPGESIWKVAESFRQATPELSAIDTRELVDAIVAEREGETTMYTDELVSFQISDNPENPAS